MKKRSNITLLVIALLLISVLVCSGLIVHKMAVDPKGVQVGKGWRLVNEPNARKDTTQVNVELEATSAQGIRVKLNQVKKEK
jgi:hypothetical protein